MAVPAGTSLVHKLASFVSKGDYSFKSSVDLIGNLSEDVRVLCGSVIPVDPTDPGEMALANQGYSSRANIQALECLAELSAINISSMSDIIRSQGLMIRKLENNDLVLLGLAENIINGKRNATSNLADLGSSTLKGAAAALWSVPGVNVAFGLAAYGGGIFLDWFKSRSISTRLRDDLSIARHLILDNAIPLAIYDGMDRVLRNKDVEDYSETVSDWISERENKQYVVENRAMEATLDRSDIIFVKKENHKNDFGIVMVMIRNGSPVYLVTVVSLDNKHVKIVDIPYKSGNMRVELMHRLKYEMCGNSYDRIVFIARTPKMAPDDILERRVLELRRFVERLRGDSEENRSLIHAFVQSGSPA